MFDAYLNTETVNTTSIEFKLNVFKADIVSLFAVSGSASIEIGLWNPSETVELWTQTINMTNGSPLIQSITNWFEYFFGEYSQADTATAEIGVVIFSGVLVIKIIGATGATVSCGHVVVGRKYDIGTTLYGTKAGIIDFSKKTTNDDGLTTLTQGYSAKQNTLSLTVQNSKVDAVYRLLTSLRGIPTVWIGNNPGESFDAMIVFGIFKDFSIVFKGVNRSGCDIEIEGLT